jgi:hypothetical protein
MKIVARLSSGLFAETARKSDRLLGKGWRDKDSVMLHACFQILKDCFE